MVKRHSDLAITVPPWRVGLFKSAHPEAQVGNAGAESTTAAAGATLCQSAWLSRAAALW